MYNLLDIPGVPVALFACENTGTIIYISKSKHAMGPVWETTGGSCEPRNPKACFYFTRCNMQEYQIPQEPAWNAIDALDNIYRVQAKLEFIRQSTSPFLEESYSGEVSWGFSQIIEDMCEQLKKIESVLNHYHKGVKGDT